MTAHLFSHELLEASFNDQSECTLQYIIWLSLMRVTDWLNILTWLKHNSVSMSPSPELRRGDIDRYHKMFSLWEIFSRKQMAKWACDTIASKMYVDRLWPRDGCLLHTQYNRYALHCAQLKENPRWKKLLSYVNFYKYFMQKPGKAMGSHIIEHMATLLSGTYHEMFLVSWGLKLYFGKIISPSTFPQYHFKPRDGNILWCSLLQKSPSV